jgi:hypothetical protein
LLPEIGKDETAPAAFWVVRQERVRGLGADFMWMLGERGRPSGRRLAGSETLADALVAASLVGMSSDQSFADAAKSVARALDGAEYAGLRAMLERLQQQTMKSG